VDALPGEAHAAVVLPYPAPTALPSAPILRIGLAACHLHLDLNQELARLEQLRRDHLAVLEALDAAGWERTAAMENTAR
jgi:hypothetical protein